MRTFLSALLCLTALVVVVLIQTTYEDAAEPMLQAYVVEHFQTDTGARNAVSAILLNYRMFDTIFEALILLTAIIGMHQFLPRASDMAGEGDAPHE